MKSNNSPPSLQAGDRLPGGGIVVSSSTELSTMQVGHAMSDENGRVVPLPIAGEVETILLPPRKVEQ